MSFEVKNGDPADPIAAIEAIGKAFTEFKAQNDKRIGEIEAKGSSDVITTEQVDKINAEISRLSEIQTAMEKRSARPVLGADGQEITPEVKAYAEAFDRFVRTGKGEEELKSLESKALSMQVGADGLFTLPKVIDSMVQDLVKESSPIREISNVVAVGTTDYHKLINLHGTQSGWVGETAARPTTNSPQFADLTPFWGELYANPAATQTMLDDSFLDVESWLANEIAMELAQAEGIAFISGNGTLKPKGFLAGAAPVATADGARAFGALQYIASGSAAALPTSADTYISMTMALKAPHRQMARWVMAKASLESIRKIKDTTGAYIWQPSLQAGTPSLLSGYPVTEAEDMPVVAANSFPVAFGNFKAGYTIADRNAGVSIRDNVTNKPYVNFYVTKRVGGMLVDSEAIKVLKLAIS